LSTKSRNSQDQDFCQDQGFSEDQDFILVLGAPWDQDLHNCQYRALHYYYVHRALSRWTSVTVGHSIWLTWLWLHTY